MHRLRKQFGFTLVEILVAMALLMTIFVLSSVNLSNLIPKANLRATLEVLVSDMRLQQLKAMSGNTEGTSSVDSYGVYFEPTQYTLFKGFTYSATSSANLVVELPEGVTFSTINVPSSVVLFSQASGEVHNHQPDQSSLILESSVNNQQMTIELNRLGTITITQ